MKKLLEDGETYWKGALKLKAFNLFNYLSKVWFFFLDMPQATFSMWDLGQATAFSVTTRPR